LNGEPYALKGASTVRGGEAHLRFLLHFPWRVVLSISAPLSTGSAAGSIMATVDHDGGGLLHRSGSGALFRYGKPNIFNTDQGSQFTSVDFTTVLKKAEIAISIDGKGAWRDNVSSSDSGGRSNMRRFISTPTRPCLRPASASVDI